MLALDHILTRQSQLVWPAYPFGFTTICRLRVSLAASGMLDLEWMVQAFNEVDSRALSLPS